MNHQSVTRCDPQINNPFPPLSIALKQIELHGGKHIVHKYIQLGKRQENRRKNYVKVHAKTHTRAHGHVSNEHLQRQNLKVPNIWSKICIALPTWGRLLIFWHLSFLLPATFWQPNALFVAAVSTSRVLTLPPRANRLGPYDLYSLIS